MLLDPSQRDHDAFRRLFDERRVELFRFLYRLTGHAHDADDLLQETFARLWRKRDQFRGDGSVGAYLRKVAYRVWLNARARIARSRNGAPLDNEPVDGTSGPEESAAQRESRAFLLREVRSAVEALPEEWRVPLLLFRYEGLSCAEIAETLGVTPKAVEMRLRKATQTLAARLRKLSPEYGA